MNSIGLDVGTYNLVLAVPGQDKDRIKREINVFLKIENPQRFTLGMLKKQGVPLIEKDNSVYILGQAAIDLAVDMGAEYRRPMKAGCLSPEEKDAFYILASMLKGIVGEPKKETTLFYSVPAEPIDASGDTKYHEKIIGTILSSIPNINANPLNEAAAIVYGSSDNQTGVGISFGSGMVNVAFVKMGVNIFQFSLTQSGDWIDQESARVTGESEAFINQKKHKIDLSAEPSDMIEMALIKNYEILIEKSLLKIKDGINNSKGKAKTQNPISIIVAGGTSSAKGFMVLFKKTLERIEMPIPIKDCIQPNNPLHAVAKGCLVAAKLESK